MLDYWRGCTGTAALELIIYVHQAAVGLAVIIHDVVTPVSEFGADDDD